MRLTSLPAVALERLAEQRVVALEQEAPAAVAHLGGAAASSRTMSVNSTVASIRSGSRSWRVPVRNSSISPISASESPSENMLSPPSSST